MRDKIHVEKFGSNLLANGAGVLEDRIHMYAGDLVEQYGREGLVVVTSGALATGRCIAAELGYEERALTGEQLSGIGFAPVFIAWQNAFAEHGVAVATTGVTHHQLGGGRWYHRLANRSERYRFAQTISENGKKNIVTVVNEPDMVSNIELMRLATGGDNDGIASRIAIVVGADSLTIRTKKGGVFDEDKQLITQIDADNIYDVTAMLAGRGKSAAGRGGMDTKVTACWIAAQAGIGLVRITGVSADMTGVNTTRFVVG